MQGSSLLSCVRILAHMIFRDIKEVMYHTIYEMFIE